MMLVDSHCHLYDERIVDKLEQIISNFEKDNLVCTLVPSCELESMQKTLEISEKYPKVFSALGIHPHDADNFDETSQNFQKNNVSNPKVVAIGEIGLDYFYNFSTKQSQKNALEWQLDFANASNLPVIFHIRDAYTDFFDICKGNLIPKNSGVLHCFGGNIDDARRGLDMGLNISFTCNITYKNSNILREVVDFVPLDRILIETDAPYMSPNHARKEPNTPANVVYVAEQIARQKSLTLETIADITTSNFFQLFKKIRNN